MNGLTGELVPKTISNPATVKAKTVGINHQFFLIKMYSKISFNIFFL